MKLTPEGKANLAKAISAFLRQTTTHCEYKQAHVPEGWAHVKVDTTGKELADLVEKEL